MMKQNVLVISTSLRKNSNSEILAKEFEKGAKAAGNTVEFISLANKQIGFCIGCLSSVSYTHLDVYKRQGPNNLMKTKEMYSVYKNLQ